MNRERWSSLPASTQEELALLDALQGTSSRQTITVLGADGRGRPVDALLTIGVEAPFDGKADVVVRLVFEEAGPAPGERFAVDPWETLDRFLADSREAARARRKAAGRP